MEHPKLDMCVVSSAKHHSPGHPEGPHRFQFIRDELTQHLGQTITWLDSEPVNEEVLNLVHPDEYVRYIKESAANGPAIVDYGDTYVTQSSFNDALNAIGGVMAALEAVMSREAGKGFAAIRPPGHHASIDKAMGFCLFNNVAIAARRAQDEGFRRVAIVDFDVHHGNGTQEIFYNDPEVLYISTHQRGIYPGTGAKAETGAQEGSGTTVNIPLSGGVGNLGFKAAFKQVVGPALERFKPDIMLVSAGYDAHVRDPLAGLQLTSRGFFEITDSLSGYADELCAGKMLMVSEGGYNPEALSLSIRKSCMALAGLEPSPEPETEKIYAEPDIAETLQEIRIIHSL